MVVRFSLDGKAPPTTHRGEAHDKGDTHAFPWLYLVMCILCVVIRVGLDGVAPSTAPFTAHKGKVHGEGDTRTFLRLLICLCACGVWLSELACLT